jgi:predicted ribosomally synthesized peptide with nif11-like leader
MSRAAEFLTTLENDSALKSQMNSASTAEEYRKVAADAGYSDISSADLKTEMSSTGDSGELSDSQLGAASGAGGISFGFPPFGGGSISW